MLELRKAQDRGHAHHGWLNSYHTFSFANYYDPANMGWGSLRVINDDTVEPGAGFGEHGHRDMEIVSYVLEGALEHKDSLGSGSVIRPGDVQVMRAGTGVRHSEFNPSSTDPSHFLQIWIQPKISGVKPNYQEKRFEQQEKRGKLRLIVSQDGRDGSLDVMQDVSLYAGLLNGDERFEHTVQADRKGYVHVARGTFNLNGQRLSAGDGAKISGEQHLIFEDGENAEVLLFDMG